MPLENTFSEDQWWSLCRVLTPEIYQCKLCLSSQQNFLSFQKHFDNIHIADGENEILEDTSYYEEMDCKEFVDLSLDESELNFDEKLFVSVNFESKDEDEDDQVAIMKVEEDPSFCENDSIKMPCNTNELEFSPEDEFSYQIDLKVHSKETYYIYESHSEEEKTYPSTDPTTDRDKVDFMKSLDLERQLTTEENFECNDSTFCQNSSSPVSFLNEENSIIKEFDTRSLSSPFSETMESKTGEDLIKWNEIVKEISERYLDLGKMTSSCSFPPNYLLENGQPILKYNLLQDMINPLKSLDNLNEENISANDVASHCITSNVLPIVNSDVPHNTSYDDNDNEMNENENSKIIEDIVDDNNNNIAKINENDKTMNNNENNNIVDDDVINSIKNNDGCINDDFNNNSNINNVDQRCSSSLFFCQYCSKYFSNEFSLESHLITDHRNIQPFQCGLCPVIFCTMYQRSEHHKTIHRIESSSTRASKSSSISSDECSRDSTDFMFNETTVRLTKSRMRTTLTELQKEILSDWFRNNNHYPNLKDRKAMGHKIGIFTLQFASYIFSIATFFMCQNSDFIAKFSLGGSEFKLTTFDSRQHMC